jgi:lipopolysaccharide cholinephosphotransferase
MQEITPDLQPRWNAIILDVLKKLIAICEEHHITYYCCGGTAIGAVRHHGMIPWDDDIDVFMARPDYDRFLEVCRQADLGDYELLTPYNTDNFMMYFSKLCKKGTTLLECRDIPCVIGMFVDIFPLDGTAEDMQEALRLKRRFTKIQNRLAAISTHSTLGEYLHLLLHKHEWGRFCYKTRGFLGRKSYRRKLLRMMDEIAYKHPFGSTSHVVVYPGIYGDKEIYPYEWVSGPVKFPFEGVEVCLSGGYDHYLRHFFGDYMQLPPVEKRESHHYKEYFNMDEAESVAQVMKKIGRRYYRWF